MYILTLTLAKLLFIIKSPINILLLNITAGKYHEVI